jgi:hypothetical protein
MFSEQEIIDMKCRLQMYGSGANAHTANKAVCYLTAKRAEKLMPLCEAALSGGEWSALSYAMRNLW